MTSPHFDTTDIEIKKEKILACFGLYLSIQKNVHEDYIIKSFPFFYDLFKPTYAKDMAQYNSNYEIKGFKIIDERMLYFGAKYKNRKAFLHPRSSFASNVTHKQSLKICEMLTCGLILMHPRGLNEGTIRNHMAPILKKIRTVLHNNIAQHLPDGVIDDFIKNNFKNLYDDIERKHPSTANVVSKNKI